MASALEKPLLNVYVTNRCVLDCMYCGRSSVSESELETETSKNALLGLISSARHEGYPRIKFSSMYGEPLMRDDLEDLVRAAVEQKYEDISLSTNGVFLKKRAKSLREAGLHRMCVSLDTLSADRFRYITGKDLFDQVVEGIELAATLFPGNIKLNVVVIADTTETEIDDIIHWAFNRNIVPQFIEVVGSPIPLTFDKYYFPLERVVSRLAEDALLVSHDHLDKRTTIILPNGKIEFRRSKEWPRQNYTWERAIVHSDGQLGIYYNERPGITIGNGSPQEVEAAIKALKEVSATKEQVNLTAEVGNRRMVS